MMDLVQKYFELNDSYKPVFTYKWASAGFYSEFNNMILSMLWCLTRKVKFRIYCKDYEAFNGDGYTHIFEPMPETKNVFHHYFNTRSVFCPSDAIGKEKLVVLGALFYKIFTGRGLSCDSFYEARTYWFRKKHFTIPELGIDGDIQHATKILIDIAYRFNEKYEKKIQEMVNPLRLPDKYIGIHVRGGDKVIERRLSSIKEYMDAASKLSVIKDVFIMSDDYTLYEDLVSSYPDYRFYTLTFPYERGFDLRRTHAMPKEQRDQEQVKVFASLQVMSQAELFIGTVSSNPGMFLGMAMDPNKVHYIDSNEWIIL